MGKQLKSDGGGVPRFTEDGDAVVDNIPKFGEDGEIIVDSGTNPAEKKTRNPLRYHLREVVLRAYERLTIKVKLTSTIQRQERHIKMDNLLV
jgi:hypothetical protein